MPSFFCRSRNRWLVRNEPCHSLRRHSWSTSISGVAGRAVGASESDRYCCKSPRGAARPGKFGNNRIRTAGSVNQNSRFRSRCEKIVLRSSTKNRFATISAPCRRNPALVEMSAVGTRPEMAGARPDRRCCRVGPGNFTPSPSQIPDVILSHHPARAIA